MCLLLIALSIEALSLSLLRHTWQYFVTKPVELMKIYKVRDHFGGCLFSANHER